MIGIFDSGFGGLSVLKEFRKISPQYDYIYFGDSLNAPYGEKHPEEIKRLTEEGVKFLFDNGAKVVILACNTAMVHSVKILQQEAFPDKKILGVTIPGAEKVVESGYKKIGVLATSNTVKYGAYKNRVHILDGKVIVQEIEAPKLVPLIERGLIHTEGFNDILKQYLEFFDADIESLVIGCTHYSLIKNQINEILKGKINIIDPSFESAIKFKDYLERHKNIEGKLLKNGKLEIYTSGNYDDFMRIGNQFINLR